METSHLSEAVAECGERVYLALSVGWVLGPSPGTLTRWRDFGVEEEDSVRQAEMSSCEEPPPETTGLTSGVTMTF